MGARVRAELPFVEFPGQLEVRVGRGVVDEFKANGAGCVSQPSSWFSSAKVLGSR